MQTKSEARSLLKTIENNRAIAKPQLTTNEDTTTDCNEMVMDESDIDAGESSSIITESQGFLDIE